jgi:hypothetical protein
LLASPAPWQAGTFHPTYRTEIASKFAAISATAHEMATAPRTRVPSVVVQPRPTAVDPLLGRPDPAVPAACAAGSVTNVVDLVESDSNEEVWRLAAARVPAWSGLVSVRNL